MFPFSVAEKYQDFSAILEWLRILNEYSEMIYLYLFWGTVWSSDSVHKTTCLEGYLSDNSSTPVAGLFQIYIRIKRSTLAGNLKAKEKFPCKP